LIRGSIEVARRNRVAGWIYSSAEPLRDKLILAFVGQRCVGAGKVDRFRKDLLEAKLGDGYCGYDFPIVLHDDENLGAVVIRMQNSDAALVQPNARMFGPSDTMPHATASLGPLGIANVTWMQDRGWLDQPEYDFLKALQNIGAYERGLRLPRRPGSQEAPALNPQTVVADLLALSVLGEVDITRAALKGFADLRGDSSPLQDSTVGVVALWSTDRVRISVEERSHVTPREAGATVLTAPPSGGIEYNFGPDRLLFLHKHITFAPIGPPPAAGITVFTAVARGAVNAKKRLSAAG
jgi:hypothetical protein